MAFYENPDYLDNIKAYRALTSCESLGNNGNKTSKSIVSIFDVLEDDRMKHEMAQIEVDSMDNKELKEASDRLFLEKKYRTLKYEKDHLNDTNPKKYIVIAGCVLSIIGYSAALIIAVKKYS